MERGGAGASPAPRREGSAPGGAGMGNSPRACAHGAWGPFLPPVRRASVTAQVGGAGVCSDVARRVALPTLRCALERRIARSKTASRPRTPHCALITPPPTRAAAVIVKSLATEGRRAWYARRVEGTGGEVCAAGAVGGGIFAKTAKTPPLQSALRGFHCALRPKAAHWCRPAYTIPVPTPYQPGISFASCSGFALRRNPNMKRRRYGDGLDLVLGWSLLCTRSIRGCFTLRF